MLLIGWKPSAANVRASSGVPDYIHVVDLADGHVAALNYLNQKGGLLTVSTGQGYSVLDMIKAFEQASRRPSPKRSPSAARATSPSAGPILALATLLGLESHPGLEQMCADEWRWQQRFQSRETIQ